MPDVKDSVSVKSIFMWLMGVCRVSLCLYLGELCLLLVVGRTVVSVSVCLYASVRV